MEKKWNTPSRGQFTTEELYDEVKKFLEQDPYATYKMYVGTDAQKHGGITRFAIVFWVQRVGNGSQYYWLIENSNYINSLRQKIMQEAAYVYLYKETLKGKLRDLLVKYNITITPHVDIGYNGKTKQFINEITGMFKGFGKDEEVVIKPYSIAASSIADKHSK